jgi:hypothetical protein
MKLDCKPLLISIVTTFALAQTAFAQSGRNKTVAPTASPSPAASDSPTPSPSPVVTAPANSRPTVRPSSIIISGKTASDTGGYHSSDVRDVSDEIKYLFELFRLPCKPVKGGTLTAQQARDRAKQETDAYVLWLGINVRLDESSLESIMRGPILDRVDYVLFRPGTGEIEYRGTVDPRKIVQTNEHSTRLPPRTQGRSHDVDSDLRRCAFEIVRVVRGRL